MPSAQAGRCTFRQALPPAQQAVYLPSPRHVSFYRTILTSSLILRQRHSVGSMGWEPVCLPES